MDIKQIVNSKAKGAVTAATHEVSPDIHLIHSISQVNLPISEAASERNSSPHNSEQPRYSAPKYMTQLNGVNAISTGIRYPSPTAIQNSAPMIQQVYRTDNFDPPMASLNTTVNGDGLRSENTAPKSFPCSSCGKGFARRSDLARHERIHSGIRPHVCEHPNCGKQFIQRSALTVHMRVHTGEKPHMCERCGKSFSDSSSLARHRRIHSGKRPYKCPFADCQKTFTRRTTLTRHQNHHTGTVEEAAAATSAALATRGGASTRARRVHSDGGSYSNNASPISTPSSGQRTTSASPNSEIIPTTGTLHRHTNEFPFINNTSLPGHLRGKYSMPSQSQNPSNFSNGLQNRPTSHPTGYDPPSILEPPADNQLDRQLNGSQNNSPHASNATWQSPGTNILSPASNGYVYPDPDPYGSNNMGQQIYYPNSNLRRPGSTEPDNYDIKPRLNEMWTTAQ